LYFLTFLSFDLFPLAWVCFVPILFAVRDVTVKGALLWGWLFGLVTNVGGFYWVVHLIAEFGGMPTWIAILGFLVLCAFQGLLLALVIALVRHAQLRPRIAPVWSLPAALVAMEFLYPLLFPSYVGNSQYEFTTLTQIVDVTGVLGLSALIGFLNGAVYELLDAKSQARPLAYSRLAVPSALLAAAFTYGLATLPSVESTTQQAKTLRVGLVQTNMGSHEKTNNPQLFMSEHLAMSTELLERDAGIELLVWPESVYDGFIRKDISLPRIDTLAALRRPLIMGTLSVSDANGDGEAEFFNSLALISASGRLASIYDKVELLAFGETLPLTRLIPAIARMSGQSWFTHGDTYRHLRLGDIKILPTVCYEDIIPSLPRRIWREDGPADVIVNVTNDSWYGDSHEPTIHLVLAAFRSIETRRALIRSTNTGISAIVDPTGRITHRTGQWTRETLVADVPLIQDGSTTIYMRVGDVLGWIAAALVAIGLFSAARGVRRSQR
jgi:apolipoprotein N-acyltransferase